MRDAAAQAVKRLDLQVSLPHAQDLDMSTDWFPHIPGQVIYILAAIAVGTMVGGPFGDRLGRRFVIWFSILAPLPFTLLLPHVSLFWTGPLTVLIGLILASAFSAQCTILYSEDFQHGRRFGGCAIINPFRRVA